MIKQLLFIFSFSITGLSLWAQVETPISQLDQSLPTVDRVFNIRTIMTIDSTSKMPLIGADQIDEIYEKASYYLSPIGMAIKFCDLEVVDNYSYNRIRSENRALEMGIVYAYPKRINIIFVNNFFDTPCGYSYHDGFQTKDQAIIFVELSCADGAAEQIAHHMGRLLGLYETNYDNLNERADESNCDVAGDRICDTPADPYGLYANGNNLDITTEPDTMGYEANCEFIWEQPKTNGEYFLPDTRNIMSPYPCKCQFTPEQYRVMVASYLRSPFKQY